MHYYLYEIRNNTDGKIYVGVHKTKVLDDGYMGSGLIITRAIEKHGVENFTKTILEYFETQEEMFAREMEIVNEEFLLREDTYNLRRGGNGGWDYINSVGLNKSSGQQKTGGLQFARRLIDDKEFSIYDSKRKSKCMTDQYKAGRINAFSNKELNLDLTNRARQANLGSIWITNGLENRKIKKDVIIPDGWNKGRIVK